MASRIRLFFVFCMALICVKAFAAPAGQHNSRLGTKDFCVKVRNESGTVSNNLCKDLYVADGMLSDEKDYFLLISGAAPGGKTSATTSDTAISTSYSFVEKYVATDPAFQTGTLANGNKGQILTIRIVECAAGDTFTLTPATATGFTSLIFEGVGDQATLLYVDDTIGWIRLNIDSVQSQ